MDHYEVSPINDTETSRACISTEASSVSPIINKENITGAKATISVIADININTEDQHVATAAVNTENNRDDLTTEAAIELPTDNLADAEDQYTITATTNTENNQDDLATEVAIKYPIDNLDDTEELHAITVTSDVNLDTSSKQNEDQATTKAIFKDSIKELATDGLELFGHKLKINNYDLLIEDECAICFGEFYSNSKIASLDCQHFFHESCITEYRKVTLYCPVCRVVESKDIMLFASLKELLNNTRLDCQNAECLYSSTVKQAYNFQNIIKDKKKLFKQLSKETKRQLEDLVINDIGKLFTDKDNPIDTAKSISMLHQIIKNIKISAKDIDYKQYKKFLLEYAQQKSCPYPINNFALKPADSFFKENSHEVIAIIRKIFTKHLKNRAEIVVAEYNENNNEIIFSVKSNLADSTFRYSNTQSQDQQEITGKDIFKRVLNYFRIDILMVKLGLEHPAFFEKNKENHIVSWDSAKDSIIIKNNGNDEQLILSNFFDDNCKKINFEKIKTTMTEAGIDYNSFHKSAKELQPANNEQNNNSQAIDVQSLLDSSLFIGNGYFVVTYRVKLPANTQASYNFSCIFSNNN